MAGQSIEKAVIGISGSHIEALNSHGVVPIKNLLFDYKILKMHWQRHLQFQFHKTNRFYMYSLSIL